MILIGAEVTNYKGISIKIKCPDRITWFRHTGSGLCLRD